MTANKRPDRLRSREPALALPGFEVFPWWVAAAPLLLIAETLFATAGAVVAAIGVGVARAQYELQDRPQHGMPGRDPGPDDDDGHGGGGTPCRLPPLS